MRQRSNRDQQDFSRLFMTNDVKLCSKLQKGFMEYGIDYDQRTLRLVSDIPETGTNGARFDCRTSLSFDELNSILECVGKEVSTRDFVRPFHANSSNNAPMLVAALVHEGVLSKRGQHRYQVKSLM